MMCWYLQVSPSGYCDWSSREPSTREKDNARLLARIRALHEGSDGVMGRDRMHEELCFEGETASPNRVARLMKANQIFGMLKRERVNKRRCQSLAEARTDDFRYIEAFHNPRVRRRLEAAHRASANFIKPSA